MTITSINPNPPIAGQTMQVSYQFARPKTGGTIGIFPAGERGCFGVQGQCNYLFSPPFGRQGLSGTSGVATFTAPSAPGQYTLVTAYNPDGGSLDVMPITVQDPGAAPGLAIARDGGGSGVSLVTVATASAPAVRPVAGGPSVGGLNLSSGLLGLPKPVLIGGAVLLFLILGRR